MPETKNLLIIVNSGEDKPYNHYAAYVVAFMAKLKAKIDKVTVFYGPQGVRMTKKGALAKLTIWPETKNLIANQLGILPEAIPDNLEQFARYLVGQGVGIASCGTFHVIDGFAKGVEDRSNIEDFITPVRLLQAADAILSADKILYY